jgi:hypothetical protein
MARILISILVGLIGLTAIVIFLLIGGVNQIADGGTLNVVWGIIRLIAIPPAFWLLTIIFALIFVFGEDA